MPIPTDRTSPLDPQVRQTGPFDVPRHHGPPVPYPQRSFAGWLEDRNVTPTTAYQYASRVGTWLRRALDDLDGTRTFFAGLPPNTQGTLRAGWNHWRVYAAERGFLPPPELELAAVLPPQPVGAAIYRLSRLTGSSWLRQAQWVDVIFERRLLLKGNGEVDESGIHLRNVTSRALHDFAVVCAWATQTSQVEDPVSAPPELTDEQLCLPIVPVTPGIKRFCDARVFAAYLAAGQQAASVPQKDDDEAKLAARHELRARALGVLSETAARPGTAPPVSRAATPRPGRPSPAEGPTPAPTPPKRPVSPPGRPPRGLKCSTFAELRTNDPKAGAQDVTLYLDNAEIYADPEAQAVLIQAGNMARPWVQRNVPALLDGAGACPRSADGTPLAHAASVDTESVDAYNDNDL